MSLPPRVLYLEDDADIGIVSMELQALHYRVGWLADGALGLDRFRANRFDLVVLDLMLPSLGGLEVCRRIRADDRRTPIIMLTARAALGDAVRGLELGADDCITKPFRTRELIARAQASLRRAELARQPRAVGSGGAAPIRRGELGIDPERHVVTLRGTPVGLTAKEFTLLALFAADPGRCFRRGELLDAVWGPEFDGFDHTVNTHINRLRAKIAGAIVLALVLAGVIGLTWFAFLTRRFGALTKAVQRFKGGDYARRIPAPGKDEIGRLGQAFNDMAATIEAQVEALRRTDRARRGPAVSGAARIMAPWSASSCRAGRRRVEVWLRGARRPLPAGRLGIPPCVFWSCGRLRGAGCADLRDDLAQGGVAARDYTFGRQALRRSHRAVMPFARDKHARGP